MKDKINFDIQVTVDGRDVSVQDLFEIDETNLDKEYTCQASRYAFFTVLAARAKRAASLAEQERREIEADVWSNIKDDPDNIPTGGRTVSDGLADKLTILDQDYANAKSDEIEATYQYDLMKGLAYAFSQRAAMLTNLGADMRKEMDMTDMHISEKPRTPRHRAVGKPK